MKLSTALIVSILATCVAVPLQAEKPSLIGTRRRVPPNSSRRAPLVVTFNDGGTMTVGLNGTTVASGAPVVQGQTPTTSIGLQISTTHGSITQTYATLGLAITHNCVLNGSDLTVTSHVTNTGATATQPITFTYPPFTFSATPTGTMPTWHSSYLQSVGPNLFHPSQWCPIGCVHAGDSNYAVAAWSPSELAKSSLIQGQWFKDGVLANPLPIELHTVESVPAGGSVDISMTLRVTTDQTTTGLLSGYKAILPTMSYTPLHKPLTQACSVDTSWVTPSNPLGYNGDVRRLDLPQGALSYLSWVVPLLQTSGGGGVIFWAPGGYQSSSWYPVDFDVNLARISATWPIIVSGLKTAGYRVGMCARIGDTPDGTGGYRRADPTNASDVSTMLTRLDYCAGTGVTMWYLDCTCEDPASTTMLAIAAKHLGAGHLFYSEYANDVSMGFAGVYCEWTANNCTTWLTESQRAELMALYPDSDWICVDRTGTKSAAQLEALGLWPLTMD